MKITPGKNKICLAALQFHSSALPQVIKEERRAHYTLPTCASNRCTVVSRSRARASKSRSFWPSSPRSNVDLRHASSSSTCKSRLILIFGSDMYVDQSKKRRYNDHAKECELGACLMRVDDYSCQEGWHQQGEKIHSRECIHIESYAPQDKSLILVIRS